MKVELLIDGEKMLDMDVKHVEGKEIAQTIKMQLEYADLHKGSKIGMLKGLKTLR